MPPGRVKERTPILRPLACHDGRVSETPRLRIQCAGSVDIDGERYGALTREAYDYLTYLALDVPGFEMGDSLAFELRLIAVKGNPVGSAAAGELTALTEELGLYGERP